MIQKEEHNIRYAPWPHYDDDEVEAVARVMKSGKVNYWTGSEAREFEKEFAEETKCKYAIALCNGTSALELAIYALDIPYGAEIITSPRTFIASASCAVMRGCRPVFADVDPWSQNITADSIRRVMTCKTKAIIAVHLAGWPCEMDSIMDLAESNGIKVIEDCAQACGARYKNRVVGSLGHVAAFSFCQDKIISTGGEGGMLTTNDTEIWKRAWSYKDHGKNWNLTNSQNVNTGFRWVHDSFGTNWRMTEMQAVIGRAQLKKLPEWLRKRQANLLKITESLGKHKCIRVAKIPPEINHAAYKAYAFVRGEELKIGWDRDRILNEINKRGIPCYSGSCSEVYLEKAFIDSDYKQESILQNARGLGGSSIMFLVHPTLTEQNISDTVSVIDEVLLCASK
jgi:dTDP-4-amino-4,6-dideoxygalactose transaminase